ncbi:MAG TPA: signal peptidase I [Gemmatimonadaceae bacterium]|nr:signal peptidase I [Gemmatimonadaceae bacterium]
MATVARKPKSKAQPKSSVAALRDKKGARTEERRASDGKKRRSAWENIKSLAVTVALFLLIRAFLIEAYRIPSESMVPSLLVGDWLFVNKLRFGPNIPFTNVNLPGYAEPRRHDVVVFKSPTQIDQPEDPNPTLVKRIVGMPGDTLHMRAARLYLNGVAQSEPYAEDSEPGADEVHPLFAWQKRYALAQSRFGSAPEQPSHDNWGPLVIPPRHYFMMGDNRYNSKDSRYWGIVPRENIRGRPMFVYYSWNAVDSDRPLPALTDIRWGRIGHWIR